MNKFTGRRKVGSDWFRILPIAMALVLSVTSQALAGASYPSLFGTSETRNDNIGLFAKWVGVLDRMRKTPEPFADTCESPASSRCHLKEWNAFLTELRSGDATTQLARVNAFMNRFRYVDDIVNWGIRDYWETPLEFLHKSGECKDYAIAKYMSLRFLGWPAEALRIVVLQDLNLRVAHAVLVAYVDGRALVLDNQISRVVHAESIRHYRPTYSLNERSWWLHRG